MSLLEIARLKKSFRSPDGLAHLVIDVDSLSMEPRAQLALSGRSGTGKTTLLHLIAGILKPDSGTIHLGGQCISFLPESRRDRVRASTVGYIFQTFNLLPAFTCLENVLLGMTFGPGSDRAAARELLKRVGLGHRLHHYPRQLSTGQQQRVAVARALANRPQLVLGDEPTGNLDPHHAAEALALIRETCLEHQAGLLLVTHDRQVLDSFERALDLQDINKAAASPETHS